MLKRKLEEGNDRESPKNAKYELMGADVQNSNTAESDPLQIMKTDTNARASSPLKCMALTRVMDPDNITICHALHSSLTPYDNIEPLRALLPEHYQYTLCKYSATAEGVQAEFRLNITTKAAALIWIEEFKEHTKTTLRQQGTKKHTGLKVVYRVKLRCHRNTLPKSGTADRRLGSKNTNCPATLEVVVRQTNTRQKSRSNDAHATTFPMMVRLNFTHNHPIHSADDLKHRDVSNKVEKIFINLFRSMHSPTSALQAYKYDLLEEYGDNFPQVSADRAICPDLSWCYRLYYKIFKKFEEPDSAQMFAHLEKVIDAYNTADSETAKMLHVGSDVCIALCSPLMKRVHSYVRQSGELVFVDGSGGTDRHGCKVFLMMTHTVAGGLPLGLLVASTGSGRLLTQGFQLLKDLLPSNAFFGRREKGPEIIVTDDVEAERKALHAVFPESKQFLCLFHLHQAMWRYLWDARKLIEQEDRPHILRAFKCMLFAKTEAELDRYYNELIADGKIQQYEGLVSYLICLYERRTEWGLCFRVKHPDSGGNVNNYSETSSRVMKDKIFYLMKAFNVMQLVDFLFTRLEKVYMRKLLDAANNKLKQLLNSRHASIADQDIPLHKITQVSSHDFQVLSKCNPNLTFIIDMDAEMCSCQVGYQGTPCKHQRSIAKHFSFSSVVTIPINSPSLRELFYKIAMGKDVEECRFQIPLKPNDELLVELTRDECSSSTYVESETRSMMVGPPHECGGLPVGLIKVGTSMSMCMDSEIQSITGLPSECDEIVIRETFESESNPIVGIPQECNVLPLGLIKIETSSSTSIENEAQSIMGLPQECDESVMGETVSENEKIIEEMSRILKERTNANPEKFHEPVRDFLKNLKNIQTEASLISAMKTFGK